jgi:hypothetical protein
VDGVKKIPLGNVLDKGEFVKPPKSPLGPYPVVLSIDLMQHWVPPKDFEQLRGAWHIGSGIKLILETMEGRIKELSRAKRDKLWLEWWAKEAEYALRLSPKDKVAHMTLYHRYKREAKN